MLERWITLFLFVHCICIQALRIRSYALTATITTAATDNNNNNVGDMLILFIEKYNIHGKCITTNETINYYNQTNRITCPYSIHLYVCI